MNEAEATSRAAALLQKSGIPDPQREARILWRAAFRRRYAEYEAAMAGGMEEKFFRLIERRCAREPMSHLLGYRDFYEHRFEVSGDALDPRPETETLVALALDRAFDRVLDLGTGSGCILLSMLAARSIATGVGTDISEAALNVARRNRARLELETRAELILSDWFRAVSGQFDLIVSNPPYIAAEEMAGLGPELSFEPRMALTDEGDGLSAYRAITAGAPEHLRAGGHLMVEIGWTQGKAVAGMFRANGFDGVEILPDLDGRDRVVQGIWRH
ncbi:peptide chain release factor N(5)-glutamine methyltransferase [Roseovarius aestuarii]|uniref:Release factor glutamine methyltransferase n=1 Tax=Roseovarius aestuarii TaxID=475083 RepID=A0A1X7BT43_9RHOB|nr:peptide chain release factor N(5)-glutamine methyltransferase [Roseovarius aestuarii]SMC12389.1 Release factor glutamine methyltransferase [Roseovarius aestuarii]